MKNVFRAAVQNGTVRPPHSRFNPCITCDYYQSSPTFVHSCAMPHRGEMHHRNVADMSDKQIEMLLKRDSSHHECCAYSARIGTSYRCMHSKWCICTNHRHMLLCMWHVHITAV